MYFQLIKKSSTKILETNDIAKYSSWSSLSKIIPLLPRGWYELTKFSSEERINLVKEFWLSQLCQSSIEYDEIAKIDDFFNCLEDIVICAFQDCYERHFNVKMIYLIKNSNIFFSGNPPFSSCYDNLRLQLWNDLPKSYYNFFNIHDGFSCYDDLGIISTKKISRIYYQFQDYLEKEELISTYKELNLSSFIPFYGGSLIHSYQCFLVNLSFDKEEPLNVPFLENNLKDLNSLLIDSDSSLFENNIFSSFIAWLGYYLSIRKDIKNI